MDTIELTQALNQNQSTTKMFQGVYPSDMLPTNLKKPALIIANTDESTKPGKHWVAFYLPRNGPIEYFDSIGYLPIPKKFVTFMLCNGTSFRFNNRRIQNLFATTCGKYCAVFLYYKSKKISYVKFMNKFGNNLEKNENKINKLYNHIFTKNQRGGTDKKLSVICNQTCKPCP